MQTTATYSASASAHAPKTSATQLGFDDLGTALIDTTFVVLDLETTGLSAQRDRITEVGAVKVRGGEVLGELQTFVNPQRSIPASISAVTGITDAMVRDAPPVEAVLPTVLSFLDGHVLVAHNAGFDLGFLRAAAERIEYGPLDPTVLDTARLARRLLKDEVRNCRLATLAQHLRARTSPEHRALADARATVDVLHGLIERAGTYGANTLEDLRDLARSSSDKAFRRRDLVREAPATTGTYQFVDERDEVLYVGKATNLRSRLRTYFGQDSRRKIADLVRQTARVQWEQTPTTLEAEVLEVRQIHQHRPRYNRRSTRPEAAMYVALTDEAFPRLSVVKAPKPSHRRTIGPLPSRRLATVLVETINEVLPLRTCTPRLRLAQNHPACVLKDLGRCGAPCDGSQSRDEYEQVVDQLHALLDDPSLLLTPLRERMDAYASEGRYERAATVRTRMHEAARVIASARDRAMIANLPLLVAARPNGETFEVVALDHGRLTASTRVSSLHDDVVTAALSARGPTVFADPPAREDAEEHSLVLAWLARPDVRVIEVDGQFALPHPGGRSLAAAVNEARTLARATRRDRIRLHADKVITRHAS